MGLFDFISGKGGGLKRTIAKATNKDAQSVDRWKAMETLADEGSEEALGGLLRRFTFNYDKTIEDEQEKQWVHDKLVELATAGGDGERAERRGRALAALGTSLVQAESIAWQLKVLEHVASPDEAWPLLERAIAVNDNQYTRDPSRKIQLVHFLGEWKDERAARALPQWLEDVDETVRYAAVEAVLHQRNEEAAREPLLKLLVSPEEESRRIKIRILDGLADLGWTTHGYKGGVDEVCDKIGRGHSVDNKGRVKKGRAG